MSNLVLDVRLDGVTAPVGQLHRAETGALTFTYTAEHANAEDALPLSLSLPLTEIPYGDRVARPFFDNLLQESDVPIAHVMARENITRDDVAGLLLHLGKDCPGALSVLPSGAPAAKVPGDLTTDYRAFSDAELAAIVVALHEHRRLPEGIDDPSPLAGVQSKLGVALLPDGSIAEPRRGTGAPTTHILKVPSRSALSDPEREEAALNLSTACGIETAQSHRLQIAGLDVLLVTRFDRALDNLGRVVRLHQEDFAQALGLPPALKYERYGKAPRIFDVAAVSGILSRTAEPAFERLSFIRRTLFDLLIGNVDGHAKNHALLHLGRNRIRLAPRYDLLPTRLDHTLSGEFSFRLGTASHFDDLTREDLVAFLEQLGLRKPAAGRILKAQVASLASDMANVFAALDKSGHRDFADMIASNIRHLLPMLALAVPPAAAERDAFVPRGGGWATS